LVSIRALQTE
jgi:hypothetical protein